MADTQKETASRQRAVPVRSDDGSLAARIIDAQDSERRKISRELHDSVGQSLVAMKMAIHKFKREHSIAEDADLDAVLNTLDSTLSEIRTLSHLLHPPNLELLGLRSSLGWLAEGFEQRTGITTRLEVPKRLPEFSATASTTIFRVAQEALTNVHRHAGASKVILRVVVAKNELQLEVADNGSGFADLEACRQGVGILGMQERLGELGGALHVESGRNAGTSVFATIPLEAELNSASEERALPDGTSARSMPPARIRQGAARVLLVDDHPAIRQGVRFILGACPDVEVCGEASDSEDATRLAVELRPDVVLLDLQLEQQNGWSVVRALHTLDSPARIIIYSQFPESYAGRAAKRAGCSGFVSKNSPPEALIEAIRKVLRGELYYSSAVSRGV